MEKKVIKLGDASAKGSQGGVHTGKSMFSLQYVPVLTDMR